MLQASFSRLHLFPGPDKATMSGHTSVIGSGNANVSNDVTGKDCNVHSAFLMPSSPVKKTDVSASKLKRAVLRANKVIVPPLNFTKSSSQSHFSPPHHLVTKHPHDHNKDTPLSHFPATPQEPEEGCSHRNSGQQKLSVELSRLCSNTFESDSDNSSFMYADESFLFSAELTEIADVDSVFDDEGWDKSPRDSQQVGDVSLQGSQKYCLSEAFHSFDRESLFFHGATIAGSPTKRRSGKHSVRRVKSASSFRPSVRHNPLGFSPRKLSRVREKWYKTRTDPCLYQRGHCNFQGQDFNRPNETKRVLQFQDVDRRELLDAGKAQLIRTETPESGYGSLNSSQQTPEVATATTTPFAFVANSLTFSQAKTTAADTPVSFRPPVSLWYHSTPLLSFKRYDLITTLHKHESSLVNHILAFLEPKDLVIFSSVCKYWRDICSSNLCAASVRDIYLEQRKQFYQSHKENLGANTQTGRRMTGSGTPLAPVQHLGRPRAESTPVRPPSVFEKFEQMGRGIPSNQSLRKCKCGSPARVDPNSSMAQCSSVHCQLEFCSKCQMGFHGNSPCPTASGSGRSRGPSVGSKKSKKNLRRHSRLSTGD